MRDGYLWVCDRCSRVVWDERWSNRLFEGLSENGQILVQRSRKGGLLHYCSEQCCRLHRGPLAESPVLNRGTWCHHPVEGKRPRPQPPSRSKRKPTKMRIDLEKFRRLLEEFYAVEKVPLENLELYENGVKIDIPPECVKRWKFTGMNNRHFIEDEFWKDTKQWDNEFWKGIGEQVDGSSATPQG